MVHDNICISIQLCILFSSQRCAIMLCSSRTKNHVAAVLLLALTVLFTSTTTPSHATATAHTLLPSQSIQDGQTLVSANGTFALGFFSPGSSNSRYVGIWYHNIPGVTVVWVANRDAPIADKSGVLTFTDDGNLVITDSRGSFIQFTFSHVTNGSSTTATLADSGNLVLSYSDDKQPLWQSFDHPTDHLLPGMLLGMMRRKKQNRFLTSWRSSDDPSPGDFTLGANPNGTKQLFIWQQDAVYWDTGVWDGKNFRLVPDETRQAIFNGVNYYYVYFDYGYTSVGGDDYFSYSLKDAIARCVLDSSGQFRQLTWSNTTQSWVLYWAQPRPTCDVFNFCGYFGVCRNTSTGPPSCQCLDGFVKASNGGCLRKTSIQYCNSTDDGFLSVTHIKYPAYETKLDGLGADECRSVCLNSCVCTAYAFSDTCQIWKENLVSMQQLDADVQGNVGTLYVRLAASDLAGVISVAGNKKLAVTIMVPVVSVSVCLILILYFLWWRFRGRKLNEEQSILLLAADIANNFGRNERGQEFKIFKFSQVTKATDNFSDANKLGEGGFGPVYKGVLAQGQEIAVKRLSARSGQGLEEFKNEILLIAKLQHTNLVRLLGCCIEREEKILIYEYMSNKGLNFFLFDAIRGAQLDWGRRFNIIEGIAQGLLYLHKHSRLRIIHRDLKASNILLDSEMNPKISDFGMARTFGRNETQANTMRVVGTYGYISPEYASEGLFSIKSDVFSFGVLLLEIVSGKKNTGFHQHINSDLSLLGYAWQLWKEGRSLELMDPLLGDACPTDEILRCIQLGLLCVQESAIDRPTMTDVITMLSSKNVALPNPKQPGFFTVRTTIRENSSSNISGAISMVTVISGR